MIAYLLKNILLVAATLLVVGCAGSPETKTKKATSQEQTENPVAADSETDKELDQLDQQDSSSPKSDLLVQIASVDDTGYAGIDRLRVVLSPGNIRHALKKDNFGDLKPTPKGLRVVDVPSESVLENLYMEPGDLLRELDFKPLTGADAQTLLQKAVEAGGPFRVLVERDGKEKVFVCTP